MIKLFLIDDHTIFRQALTGLLNESGGGDISIIGESSRVDEFLGHERFSETDVLLLDLSLEEGLSLEKVPVLLRQKPELGIIALTMHNKPVLIKRAVNLGIRGYVVKNSPGDILLEAVKKVGQGGGYLDPALSDSLILCLKEGDEALSEESNYNSLSQREQEIFSLLARGFKPDQISKKLYICKKTVENHRFNIVQKLNLASLKKIPEYAREIGVI